MPFVTFEGLDGCGKTTQLRLLAGSLRERGYRVAETVEPGGTELGRQIRGILLNPSNADMSSSTELLLYMASRAQNVEQVIRPALALGQVVLCDRFTDSTLAYQGWGRGLDCGTILELDRIACKGLKPGTTVFIDIDLETSLARARRRNERDGKQESRIDDEEASFHARVREGFHDLARQEPERIVVIDGRAPIAEVAQRIQRQVLPRV